MKNITDRVLRNPLTTLLGIAFAAIGVWILKWSDDLSETSRLLLCIVCFGVAITGFGWRDKTFIKVLEFFKGKTPMLALLILSTLPFLMGSCAKIITNRKILTELRSYKATQDSLISKSQLYFQHENKRIDTKVDAISDDADLLEYIESIVSPSPKPAKPNHDH